MKILSGPNGDGLVTNAEVLAFLREKDFERPREKLSGEMRPPKNCVSLARDVRKYLETSPAGNESVESIQTLFGKLKKFELSTPEQMMIANIRPDAYAHLTALLIDADSRFDEDTLYEMLGIINQTLPKRPKPLDLGADEMPAAYKSNTAESDLVETDNNVDRMAVCSETQDRPMGEMSEEKEHIAPDGNSVQNPDHLTGGISEEKEQIAPDENSVQNPDHPTGGISEEKEQIAPNENSVQNPDQPTGGISEEKEQIAPDGNSVQIPEAQGANVASRGAKLPARGQGVPTTAIANQRTETTAADLSTGKAAMVSQQAPLVKQEKGSVNVKVESDATQDVDKLKINK